MKNWKDNFKKESLPKYVILKLLIIIAEQVTRNIPSGKQDVKNCSYAIGYPEDLFKTKIHSTSRKI